MKINRDVELNPRWVEIARHLAEGLSYKEIAHKMGLSLRTINVYVCNAKFALDVKTSAHLVAFLLRNNVIK